MLLILLLITFFAHKYQSLQVLVFYSIYKLSCKEETSGNLDLFLNSFCTHSIITYAMSDSPGMDLAK